jgi:hypothetical protein
VKIVGCSKGARHIGEEKRSHFAPLMGKSVISKLY